MHPIIKHFVKYFLNGLLFVVPAGITVYVLWSSINWLDSFPIGIKIPGLSLLVVLAGTTIIGYLGSGWLTKPLLGLIDTILQKIPLVNLIYGSVKDLTAAFFGDDKKFDKPVFVNMGSSHKVIGFITQESLKTLDLEDHVAVYMPQAYTFSGVLLIVHKDNVTPIVANSTDLMKFIVSGGVADFEKLKQ